MKSLPTYTPGQLIAFEKEIEAVFLAGKIRAPVHFSGGNEQQLIDIFSDIKPEDWVLSTWRSHYHALLKGVDPTWLRQEIIQGRSMYVHSKEHRFLTSSIAGGILPIGLGLAQALEWKNRPDHVWCFVGDMTARMGILHECLSYAEGHGMPLTVVIEDNGLSTNTPTGKTWGSWDAASVHEGRLKTINTYIMYYRYERTMPHVGAGQWVDFEPVGLV